MAFAATSLLQHGWRALGFCPRLHLTETSTRNYFACALSPVVLLTPAGSLLGCISAAKFQTDKNRKIRVAISDATHAQLMALKESPEKLLDATAAVAEDENTGDTSNASVAATSGHQKTFSASGFTNSVSGCRNLEQFLEGLPGMWKDCRAH